MTPRRDTKRMRGFTITETVVVIAITTTVMAMVLPTMNRAREQARTVQGMANLQQIGQALQVFTIDNSNTLPVGYWRGTQLAAPALGGLETDWMVMLNGFLAGGGDTYDALATGSRNGEMLEIFKDPNATFADEGLHHYICHPLLMPDQDFVTDQPEISQYRLTRFRRPHEVILAMDGIQRTDSDPLRTTYATAFGLDAYSLAPWSPPAIYKPFFNADNNGNPTSTDGDNDAVIVPGDNTDISPTNQANIRWRQRGNTAANFMFPDGHSETKRMSDVTKRNIRIDY